MKAKKPMTIKGNHDVVHEVVRRGRLFGQGSEYVFACGGTLRLYWQYPRRRNVTCLECIAAGDD